MKIITGKYNDQITGKVEDVEVLVLKTNRNSYYGINLKGLNLQARFQVIRIAMGKEEANINLKDIFSCVLLSCRFFKRGEADSNFLSYSERSI